MSRDAKIWRAVALAVAAVVFLAAATTIGTMPGGGNTSQVLTKTSNNDYDVQWSTPAAGTVTSVAVTTANGVSGSVTNASTTPAITLALAAITPTTIAQTGKTITYNNIATVSNGVPSEYATVDLTAQSGAIGATTIYTPTATGMFRLTCVLKITVTGTSPVAGPVTITYSDGDGSVAQSHVMLLQSTTGTVVTTTVNNNTATGTVNGSMVFYAVSGTAIQYAIAVSGTFGSGRYSAHLKIEAL